MLLPSWPPMCCSRVWRVQASAERGTLLPREKHVAALLECLHDPLG